MPRRLDGDVLLELLSKTLVGNPCRASWMGRLDPRSARAIESDGHAYRKTLNSQPSTVEPLRGVKSLNQVRACIRNRRRNRGRSCGQQWLVALALLAALSSGRLRAAAPTFDHLFPIAL